MSPETKACILKAIGLLNEAQTQLQEAKHFEINDQTTNIVDNANNIGFLSFAINNIEDAQDQLELRFI